MTGWEKQRILDEARATCDRLRHFKPTPRADDGEPDALEKWAAGMPKPEPPPRARVLDTVSMERVQALVTEAIDDERGFNKELLAELLAYIQRCVNRAIYGEITKAVAQVERRYAAAIDQEITKAVDRLSRDLKGLERAVRDESVRRSASASNVTALPSRPGIRRRMA